MTWTRVVVMEMGEAIRFRFCLKGRLQALCAVSIGVRDTDLVLWDLSEGCVVDLLRQRALR